jgi:hypothetical protein
VPPVSENDKRENEMMQMQAALMRMEFPPGRLMEYRSIQNFDGKKK